MSVIPRELEVLEGQWRPNGRLDRHAQSEVAVALSIVDDGRATTAIEAFSSVSEEEQRSPPFHEEPPRRHKNHDRTIPLPAKLSTTTFLPPSPVARSANLRWVIDRSSVGMTTKKSTGPKWGFGPDKMRLIFSSCRSGSAMPCGAQPDQAVKIMCRVFLH